MPSAIDIHTHIVPAQIPAFARGTVAGWPSVEAGEDACHRNVMIDGKVYRTIADRCWNTPKRLGDMDGMRVAMQALSPMPELFSYWLPADAADDLVRYLNDQIAEMVAAGGGRLVGLGGLPLQDMDLALRELERVMGMGFAGVEIGSNVNGKPIGASELTPFWQAAEKIGAAVFVHAVRPAGMDRLVGPKPLQQVLAYPTDVGLAAASAITSNLLLRFPRLRVAFSHGGGTLAMLLPRLEEGRRVFPAVADAVEESAWEQARRMYFDTLVYDERTLRHLLAVFGDQRLIVGTDYPFGFHERHPVERVLAAVTDNATRSRLLFENARRYLGLHG